VILPSPPQADKSPDIFKAEFYPATAKAGQEESASGEPVESAAVAVPCWPSA